MRPQFNRGEVNPKLLIGLGVVAAVMVGLVFLTKPKERQAFDVQPLRKPEMRKAEKKRQPPIKRFDNFDDLRGDVRKSLT